MGGPTAAVPLQYLGKKEEEEAEEVWHWYAVCHAVFMFPQERGKVCFS